MNNGQVIRYPHNYDEYVYHLAQTLGADTAEEQPEEPTPEIIALSKLERDERRKELKKAKRTLQEIEYELMDLEKEKTKLLTWFEHHPT